MFLTTHEYLPLSFASGGNIEHKYTGSNKKIHLNTGATVAYLVIQPFSIE